MASAKSENANLSENRRQNLAGKMLLKCIFAFWVDSNKTNSVYVFVWRSLLLLPLCLYWRKLWREIRIEKVWRKGTLWESLWERERERERESMMTVVCVSAWAKEIENSVTRFGQISPLWQNFINLCEIVLRVYLMFDKMLNLFWQNC